MDRPAIPVSPSSPSITGPPTPARCCSSSLRAVTAVFRPRKGKLGGGGGQIPRSACGGGDAAARSAFAQRFASPDFCVFYDASTLIVICAKPMGPFVVADCWLAAQNLMLAAFALGLGTCCIGSAVPAVNSAEVKSELGIPPDVDAIVPIIVGVPAEPGVEVPRRDPHILHWK